MDKDKRRQFLQFGAAGLGLAVGVLAWKSQQKGETGAANEGDAESGLNAFWKMQMPGLDAKQLVMQDFKGKPLLINFWATWCPPCVSEMPLLERMYSENAAKNIQILGIAADKEEAVKRFVVQKQIHFPIAIAGGEAINLSKSLGNPLGSLPFSVFVHSDGTVQRVKIGELHEDDIKIWVKGVN